MLFDSHSHLDDEAFNDDRAEMIARAREVGVDYILNPSVDLATSQAAVALAEQYDFIYAAIGYHPHEAQYFNDEIEAELRRLAENPKVVAIGEIGLDFHYDHSPRDIQRAVFKRQIAMARELKLPIQIHARSADGEVFETLKAEKGFENGLLMHCYSGSAELAEQYVKEGAYISIAGPVTFKNNKKTPEVVKRVPLERLMVETDAPYLTPVPYRGKRNEPARVLHTCEKVAEIKGVSLEEAAVVTKANALRFFGIKDEQN